MVLLFGVGIGQPPWWFVHHVLLVVRQASLTLVYFIPHAVGPGGAGGAGGGSGHLAVALAPPFGMQPDTEAWFGCRSTVSFK